MFKYVLAVLVEVLATLVEVPTSYTRRSVYTSCTIIVEVCTSHTSWSTRRSSQQVVDRSTVVLVRAHTTVLLIEVAKLGVSTSYLAIVVQATSSTSTIYKLHYSS